MCARWWWWYRLPADLAEPLLLYVTSSCVMTQCIPFFNCNLPFPPLHAATGVMTLKRTTFHAAFPGPQFTPKPLPSIPETREFGSKWRQSCQIELDLWETTQMPCNQIRKQEELARGDNRKLQVTSVVGAVQPHKYVLSPQGSWQSDVTRTFSLPPHKIIIDYTVITYVFGRRL